MLTGETVILQTDLLYDCGKSFNPAVDIGQVSCRCCCFYCCYTHSLLTQPVLEFATTNKQTSMWSEQEGGTA